MLQERVPFKSHVAKETRLNPPEDVTSSQYISFDDPVPYHAAVKGSGSLFSVVEAGAFRAELTTVRVGRLTLQRGREDLARIGSSQLPLNRVGLLGWYSRTQLPIVRGAQILNGNWLFCGPGMESHHRSFGPVDFLVLTLDVGDLADAAVEIIGRELTVASGTLIQPPTDLDAWLRSVIDTALRLAQTAPDVLNSPLGATALESALLRPMIMCCARGEAHAETFWRRERAAVAKRFEVAVEAHMDQTIRIPELCRIIGVPERTLHAACKEQLSISPQKYLTLQRLHMSRNALLQLDQRFTTVTRVATSCGFWELGRFSAAYRAMFRELPSETLRRPAKPEVK